jgi:hypothetical protein
MQNYLKYITLSILLAVSSLLTMDPTVAAGSYGDSDGDGIPNSIDVDADNDGVPNSMDATPLGNQPGMGQPGMGAPGYSPAPGGYPPLPKRHKRHISHLRLPLFHNQAEMEALRLCLVQLDPLRIMP